MFSMLPFLADATSSWVQNVGTWATGLVALAVGLLLIVRALLDVRAALGTESKDWGKACIGLFIGIIGGLIGWWGASEIIDWFKNDSAGVPKS